MRVEELMVIRRELRMHDEAAVSSVLSSKNEAMVRALRKFERARGGRLEVWKGRFLMQV